MQLKFRRVETVDKVCSKDKVIFRSPCKLNNQFCLKDIHQKKALSFVSDCNTNQTHNHLVSERTPKIFKYTRSNYSFTHYGTTIYIFSLDYLKPAAFFGPNLKCDCFTSLNLIS